jgi:2'-5' RNA ligase
VKSRTQLSLFVPDPPRQLLEAVRRTLDPVQASLIDAHVTLCREDELENLCPAVLLERLAAAAAKPITLHFGAPERFNEHGILLPCVAGESAFQALRNLLLGGAPVRRQVPHITLAHPRNPRAPGNQLLNAANLASGISITFKRVSCIRQEGTGRWQVLQEFQIGNYVGTSGAKSAS